MSKNILALTLLFASLAANATTNNAVKITSRIVDGKSITRIFNGSLFTTICRGEIRVLTANDEVLVKEINKLVVPGDKIKEVTVALDQEIIDSEASLSCYL